jgi:hypothetical protein
MVPRPLPAAPLVVRRRFLILAPRPFPAAPVLKRCAQAVACGTARCVLQVRDRGVQAVACGARTLSKQEKSDSADVQRRRVYITGFLKYIGKITGFLKFVSLAVVLRRRWRIFQPLLCRLRLRHKTTAWASGGPAGGRPISGENQLGGSAARKVSTIGFECTVTRQPSRRCAFGEFKSIANSSRRRWRI